MITQDEIAKLRELEKKASPGPWTQPWIDRRFSAITVEDAELITHFRNLLPALLEYVENLEKFVKVSTDLVEVVDAFHSIATRETKSYAIKPDEMVENINEAIRAYHAAMDSILDERGKENLRST